MLAYSHFSELIVGYICVKNFNLLPAKACGKEGTLPLAHKSRGFLKSPVICTISLANEKEEGYARLMDTEVLPSKLFAEALTLSIAGMRKARVLPVPVLALQTRSTPDRKTGSEAACTFVHVSYFIVSNALYRHEDVMTAKAICWACVSKKGFRA